MTSTTQTQGLTVTTSGPTPADAQLLVQLAQLGVSMDIGRGQALLRKHQDEGGLTAKAFSTYDAADPDAIAILNVMRWHETIGTLVKQGLLDRGLVLDWIWVAGAWEQCREVALAHRAETDNDCMWENFEALAASQNG